MQPETIRISADGAIGSLELNRPEKLNPLSVQMIDEITEAARWFDTRSQVRAVIVSGAGRAFSAGADLESFLNEETNRSFADGGRLMADAIEEMRAVTVAAIHGACIGGGVVLAAACDLRVAADTTVFQIPEVDLGIPLAWGGIPRLVREIGPAAAKELVMTCRRFSAVEARDLGLLNRVVEEEKVLSEATALAAEIARRPRNAVSATKLGVNSVTSQMVGTGRSWADADTLLAAFTDPEGVEARRRYLDQHRQRSTE